MTTCWLLALSKFRWPRCHAIIATAFLVLAALAGNRLNGEAHAQAPRGHIAEQTVKAATRLDWVFALANQSAIETPAEWLDGYESAAQTYELYVPDRVKSGSPAGLVLFISPGERATGLQQWRDVCDREGLIFASPHAAGNQTATPRRVRAVIDVLDDVRRQFEIDPDRTFIGGFSGGGRIAFAIATALPEYFAGIVPVCAGGQLRDESWLRQRVIDRLSVALVTGETDFNRGEVERLTQTSLDSVGVRCRTWMVQGLGHGIPSADTFAAVVQWFDAELPARRKLARSWPAARMAEAVPREQWADQLLTEARQRLQKPATFYSGLMQLKGVHARWPDLPQSQEARTLLEEYDARPERPWEQEDIAEQRRFLIARARGVDAYASGPIPQQYRNQHQGMIQAAINLWTLVAEDGQDPKAAQEARLRIPALEDMLKPDR